MVPIAIFYFSTFKIFFFGVKFSFSSLTSKRRELDRFGPCFYAYWYWNQKRFIFHYKFINIWHHICFLWWDCDRCSWRKDVSTTSKKLTWRNTTSIRGDVRGRDVTSTDHRSWTLFEDRWALRPQKNVNDVIINCILDDVKCRQMDVVKWRQTSIKSTF